MCVLLLTPSAEDPLARHDVLQARHHEVQGARPRKQGRQLCRQGILFKFFFLFGADAHVAIVPAQSLPQIPPQGLHLH